MTTDLLPLLLAVLSGGVIALLLTLFGGGGSVLAVPLLLYVVGVTDPHVAIGVSAAGVALNGLTALAGHAKAGRIRWPCASLFALTGAAGAWFGSSIAKMIDGHQLLLIFAVAMAAVGLSMLRFKPVVIRPEPRLNLAMSPGVGLAGAGVGSVAGFFGIGGGFLIVPGLMASTGMSLATAQATSLLSVAAFGAATAGNYALSGWIDPTLVFAMAMGGVAGTAVGLPIARRLAANAGLGLRLFAGLILLVAAYVGVQAASAI